MFFAIWCTVQFAQSQSDSHAERMQECLGVYDFLHVS